MKTTPSGEVIFYFSLFYILCKEEGNVKCKILNVECKSEVQRGNVKCKILNVECRSEMQGEM
jgi:hypothetical protein